MEIEVQSRFDEKTMSRGYFWHLRSGVERWIYPVVGALCFVAGGWFLFARSDSRSGMLFLAVGCWWLGFRYFYYKHYFRRSIRKNPIHNRILLFKIADDSLKLRAEDIDVRVAWSSIYRSIATPDGILIYPQEKMFYWIPKDAFSSDEDFSKVTDVLKKQTRHRALR